MKKILLAAAAVMAFGTYSATAQDVGVRIGPDGVRIGSEPRRERIIVRDREPDRVIVRERRSPRSWETTGTVGCRTVTTRRVNRYGETVVTRERRC